jgi:hypothetical protein
MPTIRELYSVLRATKGHITAGCRAHEFDEAPGILLTVGISDDGSWDYQLGCNEYHGAAYFHPRWIVTSVYKNSNCLELARGIREEWLSFAFEGQSAD